MRLLRNDSTLVNLYHYIKSSDALRIFCLSGAAGVAVDLDHTPYALSLLSEGRPLHLLCGCAACVTGLGCIAGLAMVLVKERRLQR